MNEEELRFDDDKLFAYTPLPQYGDGIYKVQLVMTKEIFQECYKKWIKSQENEEKYEQSSQWKNQIESCNHITMYNLCPICKEKTVASEPICCKCGYKK